MIGRRMEHNADEMERAKRGQRKMGVSSLALIWKGAPFASERSKADLLPVASMRGKISTYLVPVQRVCETNQLFDG